MKDSNNSAINDFLNKCGLSLEYGAYLNTQPQDINQQNFLTCLAHNAAEKILDDIFTAVAVTHDAARLVPTKVLRSLGNYRLEKIIQYENCLKSTSEVLIGGPLEGALVYKTISREAIIFSDSSLFHANALKEVNCSSENLKFQTYLYNQNPTTCSLIEISNISKAEILFNLYTNALKKHLKSDFFYSSDSERMNEISEIAHMRKYFFWGGKIYFDEARKDPNNLDYRLDFYHHDGVKLGLDLHNNTHLNAAEYDSYYGECAAYNSLKPLLENSVGGLHEEDYCKSIYEKLYDYFGLEQFFG